MNCKSCNNTLERREVKNEQCDWCFVYSEHQEYMIIWENYRILEKAYIVKEAKLFGYVTIFTDVPSSPKWDDIDPKYRVKLIETIDRVNGA